MTGFAEGGGLPPPDKDRRVFAVPIEYVVSATLYVLATDLTQARYKAKQVDLEELVGFDTDQCWVNSTERLKIDDIEVKDIYTISARPTPIDDYDPAEHPDWFPIPTR